MKSLFINDDVFEIEENGNIFRDGVLAPMHKNHDGYLCICGKHNKTYMAHRLVAMCYLSNDNPEVKTEVNHKDFDRENNCVNNLEWISHGDNVRYSFNAGRYARKFGADNPNYNNDTLHEKYMKNPEYAKLKQSRPHAQNGKAKRIRVFNAKHELIGEFGYIGAFAEWLKVNEGIETTEDAVRCGVLRSMKLNRPYYKKFFFEKI